MRIFISDLESVGETDAVITEFIQSASAPLSLSLRNAGVNSLNYRLLGAVDGQTFNNMGVAGSDYYKALLPNQSVSLIVPSNYIRVKIMANASGGAILDFGVMRYQDRAAGAPIPLLFA